MIAAAVETLAWDTGRWPRGSLRNVFQSTECWDLNHDNSGLFTNTGAFSESKWRGGYTTEIPKDPWGKNYFFDPDYLVSGKWYVVVGSFGPNGVGPNWYDSDDIIIILEPAP